MELSDQALIARWQRGEADAFAEIVRRWQEPVGRFLTRYLGPCDAIADLCQDVFLRVLRSGARYEARSAFSTWLFQIALNVARDHVRRRRPVQSWSDNDPEPETQPDPGKNLCDQELAECVADELARLPEPLRLVLVLRHYQGMPFEDMAAMLKTPASTLRSRFARALDLLRRRMRPWILEETER
jgi:RNA polymerase sigma-70 factor, ECF subfamily